MSQSKPENFKLYSFQENLLSGVNRERTCHILLPVTVTLTPVGEIVTCIFILWLRSKLSGFWIFDTGKKVLNLPGNQITFLNLRWQWFWFPRFEVSRNSNLPSGWTLSRIGIAVHQDVQCTCKYKCKMSLNSLSRVEFDNKFTKPCGIWNAYPNN